MKCIFCDKIHKNKNSLVQHSIRCRYNPNKIDVVCNFINYNKKIKSGEIQKIHLNHYDKAKNLNLPKPKVSKATSEKISKSHKGKKWTDERKKIHSIVMSNVVRKNTISYSSNNVCGRTKLIECIDTYGNKTKLNGNWELLVSFLLDDLLIKWTNIIEENIIYYWEGKHRRYFPDFYLPEFDLYIEVKGYERDIDSAKWESIKGRIIIFRKKEIEIIKGLVSPRTHNA